MQDSKNKYIGVMDSGLGGLTVVKQLELILPGESIRYFGDNANCPYGNRTKEDILNLSIAMLDFLKERGVKIVAIACNTISVLIDELRSRYDFPIVSIIEEAAKYVTGKNLAETGVFATEFTIKQGLYNTLIQRLRPGTGVYGVPSRSLAALVDEGRFYDPATDAEVNSMLSVMMKSHPGLKNIILGCTHYPIVQDLFEKAAPGVSFINPAEVQARAVAAILSEKALLNTVKDPVTEIFTSGKKQLFEGAIKKLGISRPLTISETK